MEAIQIEWVQPERQNFGQTFIFKTFALRKSSLFRFKVYWIVKSSPFKCLTAQDLHGSS
jgi:hypothetical protein